VISGRPSATQLEVQVIAATSSLASGGVILTDWTPVEGAAVPGPSGDGVISWAGGAVDGDSLYPTAYPPPQLEALNGTSVSSAATLDRPPWFAASGPAPDLLGLTC